TASSTGKVTSDPEPTIALMPPAVKPAARTASACRRFTGHILACRRRRQRDRHHPLPPGGGRRSTRGPMKAGAREPNVRAMGSESLLIALVVLGWLLWRQLQVR